MARMPGTGSFEVTALLSALMRVVSSRSIDLSDMMREVVWRREIKKRGRVEVFSSSLERAERIRGRVVVRL